MRVSVNAVVCRRSSKLRARALTGAMHVAVIPARILNSSDGATL